MTLFLLFHRPVVFEVTRRLLVRTAEGQQMKISYELGGSIFSTLRVTGLVAQPGPESPVRRLEIGEIGLQYSVLGFIREGFPGLLKMVRIKDFHLEIDQSQIAKRPEPPSVPEASISELPTEKKTPVLNSVFPLIFPERVEITDFSFISRGPEGDFRFTDFTLLMLPNRPGTLRVGRFQAPGSPTFENLEAKTTFENRNFFLTDLQIGPEIYIERFNFDASRLGESRVGLGMLGNFFGGTASLVILVQNIYETNRSTLRAHADGITLDRLSGFLNLQPAAKGVMQEFTLSYEGELFRPRTWIGDCRVELAELEYRKPAIDHFLAVFALANGQAQVDLRDLRRGENAITGKLSTRLPENVSELPPDNYSGRIDLNAPELSRLLPGLGAGIKGAVTAQGSVTREGRRIDARLDVAARRLDFRGIGLEGADLQLDFEKLLPSPGTAAPVYQDLSSTLSGRVAQITFRNYEADEALVALTTRDREIALEKLEVNYKGNYVRLEGSYETPEDPRKIDLDLLELRLKVDAPRLQDFVRDARGRALAGSLKADAELHRDAGLFEGGLHIDAGNLSFNGFSIRRLALEAPVAKGVADLKSFVIDFGEAGAIRGSGRAEIEFPHRYDGSLAIDLEDLGALKPLLPPLLHEKPCGGKLTMRWEGSGETRTHRGTYALSLEDGRYDTLQNVTAQVDAEYSPESLQVNRLSAGLGNETLVSGRLTLPLDLQNAERPVPQDRPVLFDLKTPALTIDQVCALAGTKPPPVSGSLEAAVSADGTLESLAAKVRLQGRNLRLMNFDRIEPAELEMELTFVEGVARIAATLQQSRLEPVTIEGNFPFNPSVLLNGEKFDPDTPLALRFDLPALDLGVTAILSQAVRFVEGTVSGLINVTGTISKPEYSGSAAIMVKRLTLAGDGLPELTGIDANIDFNRENISISKFNGAVSGGKFSIGGALDLRDSNHPILDLSFDGKSLLLTRNKDLIARANASLKLAGPLDSARLSGRIGLVDSRLFKQILLLPLGVPGKRAAPKPPSARSPGLSFPQPPLRNWRFDVSIGTDSPFLVRGNLANGHATADLLLSGTGLEPRLEGNATIDDLIVSLPFSTLDIERGSVYFNPDRPLDPLLNLRGRSELRDYVITVYIAGPASRPKVSFTSQPPLPPEDIVALLSTGATAKELTGSGEVVAGRAAMLVLQQLYQRIFPSRPSAENDVRDKLDFTVGALDPRTGKQSLSTRYRLTPSFHMIGDLDVDGNFRGKLRYILRLK